MSKKKIEASDEELDSEAEFSEVYSDYLGPTTDRNNIVVKSRGFK